MIDFFISLFIDLLISPSSFLDYPLNLSISLSGGKENKCDLVSIGDRRPKRARMKEM